MHKGGGEMGETGAHRTRLKREVGESSAGRAEGRNELTHSYARFAGKGVGGTQERAHAHA